MTAFMPNHSLSWDRVLPAPHALLNGNANDLLPRRSSSLLQHHLFSPKDLLDSPRDRRSTVPSISYQADLRICPIPPIPQRGFQDSSASDQPETGPLTRKRAASLMADESKIRDPSPATTQDPISEKANQFCLCQPDPKIPRPRNGTSLTFSLFCFDSSLIRHLYLCFLRPLCQWQLTTWIAFILYRQHHQAAVVAKHPGLPNPEISKIIGEEWRALPTKTKNQWKALSEVSLITRTPLVQRCADCLAT
jgi:HMG box factor, other